MNHLSLIIPRCSLPPLPVYPVFRHTLLHHHKRYFILCLVTFSFLLFAAWVIVFEQHIVNILSVMHSHLLYILLILLVYLQ